MLLKTNGRQTSNSRMADELLKINMLLVFADELLKVNEIA
jgi:hypothetical protein